MPQVRCKICSSFFYAKPNWLKIGYGKYCSIECRRRGQLKGKFIHCHVCKKKAWKMPADLNKSISGKFFCSKSCQTKWRNSIYIGSKHINWKNGESAYRNILLRNKISQVCRRCGLTDSRVLSAHHLDRNRKNNNLHNLAWLCYNCHYLIHHDNTELSKFMVAIV